LSVRLILQRVSDQMLKYAKELFGVDSRCWKSIYGNNRPSSLYNLTEGGQGGECGRTSIGHLHGRPRRLGCRGVRQESVDQPSHPFRRILNVTGKFFLFRVGRGFAAQQELGVADHSSQRLSEIMSGRICELLQV